MCLCSGSVENIDLLVSYTLENFVVVLAYEYVCCCFGLTVNFVVVLFTSISVVVCCSLAYLLLFWLTSMLIFCSPV